MIFDILLATHRNASSASLDSKLDYKHPEYNLASFSQKNLRVV